ncbi:membrane protein [Rossellomorea marisflavi]|uniref:YggT family protein n=1 Tax=Rossellomorea marisflavi TaxID=189381 RepID=UPI0025C924B4|nr:YggT family protein [Rossellomorea marisflavi]GLI86261.1 membrane protein [Rossellomorea marisflavi]
MFLIYQILSSLLNIYMWALIIYILMSWFPNARETSIGQILARICEPYLEQFRKFIPPLGMIDISPIVAFIVLRLADKGLSQLFYWIL